ncbi:MAG: WG repeat-containing protein [Bacteroidota bacterium]
MKIHLMRYVVIISIILLTFGGCISNIKSHIPKEAPLRIYKNGSWGYLNRQGDTLIPLNRYKFLNPIDSAGMILAHNSNRSGYINIKQDTLIDFVYEDLGVFSNGLAPAKKNGKWGFLDRDGNTVIQHQFDNEGYFYRCGLAVAKKDNKWGFIDKSGNTVVPIIYDGARYNRLDFYVCLQADNKWAFFSCDGKTTNRIRL